MWASRLFAPPLGTTGPHGWVTRRRWMADDQGRTSSPAPHASALGRGRAAGGGARRPAPATRGFGLVFARASMKFDLEARFCSAGGGFARASASRFAPAAFSAAMTWARRFPELALDVRLFAANLLRLLPRLARAPRELRPEVGRRGSPPFAGCCRDPCGSAREFARDSERSPCAFASSSETVIRFRRLARGETLPQGFAPGLSRSRQFSPLASPRVICPALYCSCSAWTSDSRLSRCSSEAARVSFSSAASMRGARTAPSPFRGRARRAGGHRRPTRRRAANATIDGPSHRSSESRCWRRSSGSREQRELVGELLGGRPKTGIGG